ncbi:hypothetical protein [Trichormus azollae]|jgi:hypothetical protein|uniref:hypothetical protein n=1 Tax=Trichormus azollae TaxID=1164 RepID=UPI0001957362
MKTSSIHQVAIIYSDYQKAKHFHKILDCQTINQTFRSVRNSCKLDLKLGNNQVKLFFLLILSKDLAILKPVD